VQPSALRPARSPGHALAVFDALEPVPAAFMFGAWRGSGWPTQHPLDGVLELCGWHGKRFDSSEHVHPLLFRTLAGALVAVHPRLVYPGLRLVLRFPALKVRIAGQVFRATCRAVATRGSRARPARDRLPRQGRCRDGLRRRADHRRISCGRR
jgi:hypothetical protein